METCRLEWLRPQMGHTQGSRRQAKEQSMSTASNSVTQVTVTTAMDPNLYGADEPMARKTERAEASFMATIVGRSTLLPSILSDLQVVAPTDVTVLITGETGTGKGII